MAPNSWRDETHDVEIVVDPSYDDIDFTTLPGEPFCIAVDVETCEDNPDKMHLASGHLRIVGFTFDGKKVYLLRVLEYSHAIDTLFDVVRECLSREAQWILHNSQFDLAYLAAYLGNLYTGPNATLAITPKHLKDTRLLERALYANWYKAFGLRALVARRFDVVLDKDVRSEFTKMTRDDAITDEQLHYAALDVAFTRRVYSEQRVEFERAGKELRQAAYLDARTQWSTLHFAPAPVAAKLWDANAKRVLAELEIAARKVPVKASSPKQVLAWLQKLGVPVKSTNAKDLKALAPQWSQIRDLLEVRRLTKLATSYGEAWLARFVDEQGYVRPSYNVYAADTSRWGCNDPNLQNIPRGEYRKLFVAPEGYSWVIADYSQQEVWIAAYKANDQRLMSLLRTGDVYTEIGRLIYRDPAMGKSDKRRQLAKSAVLGLLYGLTPRGMAKNQGITEAAAQDIFTSIKREFPMLWRYIHDHAQAYKDGFVKTQLGHRYWLNLFSWNWGNNAANSPVQGTGADMVKLAVCEYTEKRPREISLVVHDEIAALVETRFAPEAAALLEKCMADAFEACLPGANNPRPAVAHIGATWADKE